MVNNNSPEETEYLSKTQKKQQAHELQDLARTIAEMPVSKRKQLQLPPPILDAIEESKRITSHIARKRHFQYMGKLLLKSDYQAIIDALEQQEQKNALFQVRDRIINNWIDQFMDTEADHNAMFSKLYENYDHAEIQELRALLRNLQKQSDNQGKRKKVFQALRALDNQHHL
ncbi:ribosome biogenesis factor YjgA [Marinicella sp. W31]|uniref:ribosome biogenesis factor YjgA n=1 Tax=Marinicella sp. W31 TaxID=3023713 RepID=UPI0037577D78